MLIVFNLVVFRENFMSKHGDRFSEIAVLPKKAIFLRKTLLYMGHLSAEADTVMNTALDLSLIPVLRGITYTELSRCLN